MKIMALLQCPLPCHKHKKSQTDQSQSPHSIDGIHSESSSNSASLSSQPSLPSVPSLTSQHSLTHQSVRHRCLATLKNSSASSVCSLTLHGKFLYSGYSDSKILAWNKHPFVNSSNYDSFTVATSQGAVKSLIAVKNLLFSAHQDFKIRVWKINDRISDKDCGYDLIATLPTMQDRFLKLFSEKNYVQVRRHKKCTWVHHVDTVSALAVSNDKSLLYSASWDRSFKIWRTSDFKCLESVGKAHDDAINSIALSNEGFVYTGSADMKIKVWKRQAGEKKHTLADTLEKHRSAVNALALSSDGHVLYSGACDRSILVWQKHTGDGDRHMVLAGALRGHSKAILCLAVVNDLVCSGSADNTVRIWRGRTEKKYSCLSVLEGHRKPVKCLTVAVDNSDREEGGAIDSSGTSYLVYSGSLDGDIRVWNIWIPSVSSIV